MKHILVVAVLLLSGCDKPQSAKEPMPPTNSEFGRYTMIPAAHDGPLVPPGGRVWSAWRLDTKTGDLEFCYYFMSLAPVPNNQSPPNDELTCSSPVKGQLRD